MMASPEAGFQPRRAVLPAIVLAAAVLPAWPARATSYPNRLQYTKAEDAMLATVQDGDGRTMSGALFMLLKKASSTPPPSGDWADALHSLPYERLLLSPAYHRGMILRLPVRVCLVHKFTVANGYLPPGPHWAEDRPVWRVDCLDARVEDPEDAPLMIFTTINPQDVLGEGELVEEDSWQYSDPPEVDLVGLYYKLLHARPRDGGAGREYPCLVAWKIMPDEAAGTNGATVVVISAIILVLIGLMVYLRRVVRRSRREDGPRGESPRAGGANEAQAGSDAVDPDLVEAARRHERERDNPNRSD